MSSSHNETVTILLGFGGSGGKTLAHLMEMMANDPQAAEIARDRLHLILCDTDDGDLERSSNRIHAAFERSGLADPPPVERFRLADSVDLFQDLVSERMKHLSPEQRAVMRQHWWFEPAGDGQSDRPFSAGNMPENVNRGAAQCPLVSHFLAWDKLDEFEKLLERVSAHAKNHRHLERFSVDLFVVAGLAGGTGRGSWQALSFKAREFFWQDRNGRRACRPIGFFFDASCFENVAEQRPEQAIKLQVNSYTGLSELSMWLRSALPIDSRIASGNVGLAKERAFVLPGLHDPTDRSSASIDTERYMPEHDEARLGRTPIHRAYVFTRHSQSLTMSNADEAYHLAAAAIYGRIAISHTRSADANEPARACATATSMLYVPISRIRQGLLRRASARRIERMLHGASRGGDVPQPLTQFVEKQLVADHPEMQAAIKRSADALRGIAAIGNQASFASLGSAFQIDPDNPLSVIAFAVSRRGDKAAMESADSGDDRNSVCHEVSRAIDGAKSDMVRTEVANALLRDVLKLKVDAGTDKATAAKLLRRALFKKLVEDPVIDGTLRTMGVGPACVLATRLLAEAEEAKKGIADAIAASEGAPTDRGAPSGSADWTKPYFGLFGRFKKSQLDAFRQDVRERICASAHRFVAAALDEVVQGLAEDTRQLHLMLEGAVGVLERERLRANHDAGQTERDCFTALRTGDGRLTDQEAMLSSLEKDRSSPVSKMVREVRPLLDRRQLELLVDGLVGDSRSVQLSQAELIDFLADDARASERRTGRSSYEFRSRLEERLRGLLKRQTVEFKQLQSHFNLENVLGDLMTAWFDTYLERRGDAQFASRLDNEVELLTGISLGKIVSEQEGAQRGGAAVSADELRPPTPDEVIVRASLKLAAGCDPFIQYAGSADRRDRATVFVPNSTSERLARAVAQIDKAWKERGNFAHVKAVPVHGNHFMLVATSDLPKEDFTDVGWDGWFEDPSDPKVRKWLEWCEDPSGIAPFKTVDGSVGLGYISPQYVRNPHFSARRWKVWVNEGRSREQMHRKWVALAYALLGNQPYTSGVDAEWSSRYDDFVRVFRETFATAGSKHVPNTDFPAELWSMPLLLERPGGRGPSLSRRLFVQTAQGTRMSGMETKEIDSHCESMRKFVNWFESEESDRAVTAMLVEQSIFANMLQRTRHTVDAVHTVTSSAHVEACRKFLREYASQWQAAIREVRGLAPEERENQTRFLERFIHFFDHGMPDLDLFQPFDGARS